MLHATVFQDTVLTGVLHVRYLRKHLSQYPAALQYLQICGFEEKHTRKRAKPSASSASATSPASALSSAADLLHEENVTLSVPFPLLSADLRRRLAVGLQELEKFWLSYYGQGRKNEQKHASKAVSSTSSAQPLGQLGAAFRLTRVADKYLPYSNASPQLINAHTASLQDIVSGDVQKVVFFNYMIHVKWVLEQCPILLDASIPVHFVCDSSNLAVDGVQLPNLHYHTVNPWSYGVHHSKSRHA